jgi:uncharacterized membrane protein
MSALHISRARRATLGAWTLLGLALLAWPLFIARSAAVVSLIALAVLLMPLSGFWRSQVRTLRWAPMTLAPALTLALTELIANPAARGPATLTLALVLIAFTADIAWLRVAAARH